MASLFTFLHRQASKVVNKEVILTIAGIAVLLYLDLLATESKRKRREPETRKLMAARLREHDESLPRRLPLAPQPLPPTPTPLPIPVVVKRSEIPRTGGAGLGLDAQDAQDALDSMERRSVLRARLLMVERQTMSRASARFGEQGWTTQFLESEGNGWMLE